MHPGPSGDLDWLYWIVRASHHKSSKPRELTTAARLLLASKEQRQALDAAYRMGDARGVANFIRALGKPAPPPLKSREEKLVEVKKKRAEHARTMLAKWEQTEKRAKTHAKKWRTKVRYYERLGIE